MTTFATIGLIVSIVLIFTTKPVANLLAPKKEGFFAIPRTILSMGWFVVGPFISIILALSFALVLALAN